MKHYIIGVVLFYSLTAVGCSPARSPDATTRVEQLAAQVILPGYAHVLGKSLFKPGAASEILSRVSDEGFEKVVGSDGVFATDAVNGWVLATPNAGAASTLRPPYPGNGDDHNARVLSYFLAAGIPQEQIGGVDVHTLMRGGSSALGERTPDALVGYYSLLKRVIQGHPVAESIAWARFNVDGDVVEESVFWPELPAAVVDDANAIGSTVSDASSFTQMRANIETASPGYGAFAGRAVIHHADSTYHGSAYAVATYDVVPPSGGRGVSHFDKTGRPVTLASETIQTPSPAMQRLFKTGR